LSGLLKVDLHLHSRYSFDCSTSLERLSARGQEVGLDLIDVTDHNTDEGALELGRLAPGLASAGEEVRTSEGDLIGLFITAGIPPGGRTEDVCDIVHAMGGLTYMAHPLDRRRACWTPERVVELAGRIDIIETFNPWCEPGANRAAAELAEQLGKPTAGGSDAHAPHELGQSWMEMEPYEGVQDFLEKLAGARHFVGERTEARPRA